MKKQTISIIILSVMLCALVGIFFLVKSLPNNTEISNDSAVQPSQTKLITRPAENISSVCVTNSGGKFTINIESSDGSLIYSLNPAKQNGVVSQSSLQLFIDELTSLVPMQTVESQTDDFNKYGLSKSRADIMINYTDGTNEKLILGNEAPLSMGYYLKNNNSDAVYLISMPNSEIFLNNMDFYFEK